MGRSQAIDSAEEKVGKSMNVEQKKMKKITFLLTQEELDYILSIRPKQVSGRLIERNPHSAAGKERLRERILAEQERIKREYEAKGYATYVQEVPDNGARYEGELDQEEEDAGAVVKQDEATIDDKKDEDASAVVKQDEVIVDEKKEGDASAPVLKLAEEDASLIKQAEVTVDSAETEVTEGAAPLTSPGRGRRRFRPGVVKKTGGGVKKIIM